MLTLARLRSLVRKEFIQTLRDVPMVVLVLYSFGEIVLCGWSLTMDVKHSPTAIVDRDNSAASRALIERFRQADSFRVEYFPAGEAELERLLDTGRATLGVIIPPGLGRDLASGEPASVQVLVDGTQPNSALLSMGYVTEIVRRYSSDIEVARLSRSGPGVAAVFPGGGPSVLNRVRAWYLPEMQYIHFNMVAMVALSVVMLGTLLSAAGIVREKETGTLEQLMVTPIRPLELMLAKILPLIALELIGLGLGTGLGYVVFGVAPHGNRLAALGLFYALSTLAFLASAGIGIWIATVARNLLQALLMAFFVLFPMMFLSGTITPVTAMPVWLQWISWFSPMRHYLALALSLFLKGAGLGQVWPHAGLLAGFTTAVLAIGLLRFRRSLV